MMSIHSIDRHSGAGRNPAKTNSPRSGQAQGVAPLAREILNNWIDETTSQSTKPASWQVAGYPACAGMTGV
jgi:hypothetical protein